MATYGGHVRIIDNALSIEECFILVNEYISKTKPAAIGGSKRKVNKSIRDASNYWIRNTNHPLLQKVLDAVKKQNTKHWNFNADEVKGLQFISYAEGGHYDWHLDIGMGANSTRKLSFVLLLSPIDDFKGADLVLKPGSEQKAIPFKQGTLAIFPSFILHKVTPLIEGNRHVLVGWLVGKTPFA